MASYRLSQEEMRTMISSILALILAGDLIVGWLLAEAVVRKASRDS